MGWPALMSAGLCTGAVVGARHLIFAAGPHHTAPAALRALSALYSGNSRPYTTRYNEDDDKVQRPATPWVRQVISGVDLMRHPKYNKGLAFSEAERDRLYLRGLLPPAVLSQEVQLERAILNIRSKEEALDKYSYLQSLQGRNERLFYRWGAWLVLRLGRTLCVHGGLPPVGLLCRWGAWMVLQLVRIFSMVGCRAHACAGSFGLGAGQQQQGG